MDARIMDKNIIDNIQMVDLKGQYLKIKSEVDDAIQQCISQAAFIQGPDVKTFAANLATYLNVKHVIPVANGTDALQIAMMALGLKPGDEVIVPAFTYVATAEVIALLGLTPVWIDVDAHTFTIDVNQLEAKVTPRTKAIVPVHLYGQCAQMEQLMQIAHKYNLFVIEDTAQAIGSKYTYNDGNTASAGAVGHIGCTSFFPSKNLGCYGDGGAMYTNDDALAEKIRMIANHGQKVKYYHDVIGVNSRLDTLQAAILNVKLKHLDSYAAARNVAANFYDIELATVPGITIPYRVPYSTHVFHQYTLKVADAKRDELQRFLQQKGIPTMIYYPVPMHLQKAYVSDTFPKGSFAVSEQLSEQVLSLPMHTEMNDEILGYITTQIKAFFAQHDNG
jgi:UDP-2-acetamido-2-deoxy-ribo-hexuluronate aminotransferase